MRAKLYHDALHSSARKRNLSMRRRNGGRECYITRVFSRTSQPTQQPPLICKVSLGLRIGRREESSKVSLISFPTRTWHPSTRTRVCVDCRRGTRLLMCKPNLLKTRTNITGTHHPPTRLTNVAFEKTQMISRSGSLDISACALPRVI